MHRGPRSDLRSGGLTHPVPVPVPLPVYEPAPAPEPVPGNDTQNHGASRDGPDIAGTVEPVMGTDTESRPRW
jgi:hypothetical protein